MLATLEKPAVEIRATVREGGRVVFAYRDRGGKFIRIDEGFLAHQGRWVGARFGVFARTAEAGDKGYADFDYVRVVTASK